MGSKSKILLFGLVIAAIIGGVLYYFLREEPPQAPKKESIVSRMAFTGTHLTETQDGSKIWDMSARIMEVDGKTQLVYMTDLQGALFRPDGTKIEVTGKNAVIDPKTRNIEMSGGIAMKAGDGSAFNADKAVYVAKDRKIFATGSVRMTKDEYVLTANELETDDKFDLIVVKGNARIVKGGPAQ